MMSELARALVQQALDQDFTTANKTFDDMMGSKLSDALDQEKVKIANSVYNGIQSEEDDHDEDDLLGDEDGDQLELDLDTEDGDEETTSETEEDADADVEEELELDDEE